jgi:NitT/TauT family transport system ATP-binding protein
MISSQSKIKLVNINKTFKTRRKTIVALKDINIDVAEKEFVAIVGPSGCGKSTIIRMIDDIIKPTSGEIYIDGEKYGKSVSKSTIQKIGFIFQSPNLLPWLTVRQNVEFTLRILKINDPSYSKNVYKLLDMMNLRQFENSLPSELSQSMLQRVGVVRAMVHNPEILLMDEPYGQLDETMRQQLDMELLDIWSKLGQTIIFITHDVSEAVLLADRIYVMSTHPGQIVEEIRIDIPRPRTLDIVTTEKFAEYEDRIVNLIGKVDLSEIK